MVITTRSINMNQIAILLQTKVLNLMCPMTKKREGFQTRIMSRGVSTVDFTNKEERHWELLTELIPWRCSLETLGDDQSVQAMVA